MVIQTNIDALNALRNLGVTEAAKTQSIQRLSSGFRLNRSGDDAAGMSIANSLRSDGRALQQAQRNASQAGSFLQIADGAVQTVSTILDRMKELATESASSNLTDADRAKAQAEFTQLQSEITRIAKSTVYQGQELLTGNFQVGVASTTGITALASGTGYSNMNLSGAKASTTYTLTYDSTGGKMTLSDGSGLAQTVTAAASGTQTFNFDKLGVSFTYAGTPASGTIVTTAAQDASFRVGAGAINDANNLVSVSLGDITATGLGIDAASASIDTNANATAALGKIDAAVSSLNNVIGAVGAAQNRIDYATANVNSMYQNVSAAESTIRDTNMAQEYTNYTKLQIMQQAGTAMLSQANMSSQSVLKLLGA